MYDRPRGRGGSGAWASYGVGMLLVEALKKAATTAMG
jgi:hypothetical protein